MNTKRLIEEVGTDVSGKWMAVEKVETIISKVTEQCILAVRSTALSHVRTTYDLDLAQDVINKSIANIKACMTENG